MPKMVNLTIDGLDVTVPEGTLVVNAAKLLGVDIPVFCYHPKMEPVGMCRMCMVEIGRPIVDRTTGEFVRETDGSLKLQFGPKLETACTTPVSEGMAVVGMSEKADRGRRDILEFLLTSHPLDCPICDKGGECPLQNLTLAWGPGQSRYIFGEKMRLSKHVPLGELIYLDRERCIQCGRCVRFQDQIVSEPVIGFSQRGRYLEIVTLSEPGFASYFSGNTTDICPVGALTTADFRFKARPWELRPAASICNQCPVGCNLTFNVRREAASGGGWVIKRAMPRQNEWVNEIWICDKGRFGYHYSKDTERLTQPLVRKSGELSPASWEEALSLTAERFRQAGPDLLVVAGGRLANEDLFNMKQLADGLGAQSALYAHMAGGDLTASVGLAEGSNLSELGAGSAILIVASDLIEEAPIWWLRIKQAAERGADLIMLNPRSTKLEHSATHVVRYPYGSEAASVLAMINLLSPNRPSLPDAVQDLERSLELQEATKILAKSENLIVFYGSEGMGLAGTQALAQACANLLIVTGHVGRLNNGLVGVWSRPNDQGAWDLNWRPRPGLRKVMQSADALYIAAADPAGDDPGNFTPAGFMVCQELFLTATARLADVVLPVQAWTEREGTFTSGERRVQRFFPVVPEYLGVLADFSVAGQISDRLGIDAETMLPSKVFAHMTSKVKSYSGLSYARLAEVVEQWPIVGRSDMYYGGTTYENSQGIGVQAPLESSAVTLKWPDLPEINPPRFSLLAVPVTRLFDRGTTLYYSRLLHHRIPSPYVSINPEDAERLRIPDGGVARVSPEGGNPAVVTVRVDPYVPPRVVLAPRSFGLAIDEPTPVELMLAERIART